MATRSKRELCTASPHFLDTLFLHRDATDRHVGAPFRTERETYLRSLAEAGYRPRLVRERAATLLLVAAVLSPDEGRLFDREDIVSAVEVLLNRGGKKPPSAKTVSNLVVTARGWCTHVGIYKTEGGVFQAERTGFRRYLTDVMGYLPTSQVSAAHAVGAFLQWVASGNKRLKGCDG